MSYRSIPNIYNLVYPSPTIRTPYFKAIELVFADDTATGRPSPLIDHTMTKKIMPYYANTHSNSYTGLLMRKYVNRTKQFIREYYNLTPDHVIIFTGSGATAAINHIVNSIDVTAHQAINIMVSLYEHHSNYLPWVELEKRNQNVTVKIIPMDSRGLIDLEKLEQMIDPLAMNIVSITACSNVTGQITDQTMVIKKVKSFPNTLIMMDYACLSPYKQLDLSEIDGAFISGHKFLGGTGCPGLLITKKILFEKSTPFCPGGGCVVRADSHSIEYSHDIEAKESAGTPNIAGIIRFYYVLKLQQRSLDTIHRNEMHLVQYVDKKLESMCQKYSGLKLISLDSDCLSNRSSDCLPIYSVSISGLHYNYVVTLFNDMFGIQVRGGVSCCGNLADYMKSNQNIDGWTRVTFSWRMDDRTVDYILDALEFIVRKGTHYLDQYTFNKATNLWMHKTE
jgi:selenocysteine lyase/cysteine desulfurase